MFTCTLVTRNHSAAYNHANQWRIASSLSECAGQKYASEQESLDQLIEHAGSVLTQHCKVAVFTLGSRGAVAVSSGLTARCHASKVQVADTVGAGDAFCGAFLAAYMRGAQLQVCVEMGCAAGAEAVQCHGARLPGTSIQSLRGKLDVLTGDL